MKTLEDRKHEAKEVGLEMIGQWLGVMAKTAYRCTIHGEILQTPNKVQQGIGCPKCGRQSQFSKRRSDEDGIADAARRVGLEYVSGFVSLNSRATYRCHKHGLLSMFPSSIRNGCRCKRCSADEAWEGRRTTRQKVEEAAASVGLALVGEFVDLRTPAVFLCEIHGENRKQPIGVLSGRGCPSCAKTGFKPSEPATFYVYRIHGRTHDLAGFGITSDVKRRHANHKGTLAQHGMTGEIVYQRDFELGSDAMALEFAAKTRFKDQAMKNSVLGFKTEALKIDHLAALVTFAHSFSMRK